MNDSGIISLKDLKKLRSAPILNKFQEEKLIKELAVHIKKANWLTIGIMAQSSKQAIDVLKEIENFFEWLPMKIQTKPKENGPVFLKANQKTGDVHVRIEYGLGEGVILSCQYDEDNKDTDTHGPFPLNLFKSKESERIS